MSPTLTEGYMTGNKQSRKSKKYVVIHGHFYQPPRENPWINLIERQPSAAPHHDWNERIYDQCYRPNAYSRLLDGNGMIVDIYNNYLNMSYNFGPTLFSWLEKHHPLTAKRIISDDQESCARLEGHGNAIAQVFNHIIMPLSSKRDQLTQIRWAKTFFKSRFGREPEGIWLGEAAINAVTVQCLIEEKIKFVILAPSQVESFRSMEGNGQWISTAQHGIDTRMTYRIYTNERNPKSYLDAFFFDDGLSREISFGQLLTDAHILGNRIRSCFTENSQSDQLVTIATDGETFGHHKPFGDMCLAYFFKNVAAELDIIPVNFGFFLAKNPPRYEVILKNANGEGTAWSCAHGVGRWARDCGCKTGGESSWKQLWRAPLRNALEKLQKKIDTEFELTFASYNVDPWVIRDKYIAFENCSWKRFKWFLERQCGICSSDKELVLSFKRALEAQKYSLFSFTSCGWFFSDISGIETVQNLAYACRALQLGIPQSKRKQVLDDFLKDLESAKSNLPNTNGRTLIEQQIMPFFEHEMILAFTASILKSLGIQKLPSFDIYDYSVKLQQILTSQSDSPVYNGYMVQLENESSGETGSFAVLIALRKNSDITGWVVPGNEYNQNFLEQPETWMGHSRTKVFSLVDIFQTSQQEITSHFLHKISRDTNQRFGIWRRKHLRELDILSRLNQPLPLYCTAPLSFVFQDQWDCTIKKMATPGYEDELFSELLEMYRTMNRFQINIDLSHGAIVLEKILIDELETLQENLSVQKCDRIRYLLNLVDRFSIPVSKHKLEDMFHPLLSTKVQELYEKLNMGHTHKNDEDETRDMFLKLINFARRMNFNTDKFHFS